ncbi:uncharacterized protein LOC123678556 [Harmonia axyridis]|uniref:uncharacterized protein LOC123678556 n=1 Tax=Harmonia axyridis TaxID=115357 RepID=UPI001E27818C|nr:uncharacterized protein LOC123678556 [Harmonia axyridis]
MIKLNNSLGKHNCDEKILENYKSKYRNRVYYGNVCNYCFDVKIPLKKCSQCSSVSYCSKEHQLKDWKFHKPTCIALNEVKKKVAYPKACTGVEFFQYRHELLSELRRYRNWEPYRELSLHETEICFLPRVCAICYSQHVTIDCQKCLSVSYCSEKHSAQDKAVHNKQCRKLELCKVFNSLGMENGFKLNKAINYVYQPINRNIKEFPDSLFDVGMLIQKESRALDTEEEFVNMMVFLDPFAPAAFIIHVLENSGCVRKRYLKSKLPTRKREKFGLQKKNSTLTIHLGIANDLELFYEWDKIARLLTDWFINIDKVQVILVGPFLENKTIPEYDQSLDNIEVIVYPVCYYEAEDLPIPDIVVFFEWTRILRQSETPFTEAQLETIFKYQNVPVVFSSGGSRKFDALQKIISKKENVNCLANLKESFFLESKPYRLWVDFMTVYVRNRLYSIYMKS